MHCQHLVSTFDLSHEPSAESLGRPRRPAEPLVHLFSMDAPVALRATVTNPRDDSLSPVLTRSELATRLGVSVLTLYDLRSQGRGPRGFRVGRQLTFRVSEIDAWLARMEDADAKRHPVGGH